MRRIDDVHHIFIIITNIVKLNFINVYTFKDYDN